MTEHDAALDSALTDVTEHDDVTALAVLEPIVAVAIDQTSPPDPRSYAIPRAAWPVFGRIEVPTGSAPPG